MILFWLIVILLIGGITAWLFDKISTVTVRVVSLVTLLTDFIIIIVFWTNNYSAIKFSENNKWITEVNWNWIPEFGIKFHLAVDGLSLLLIALTIFLGIISVLISWSEITEKVGFYHFNILWILSGILGVFLSLDLFMFYFFWEVMLIPMYFIIGIYGHENRIYAAYKFFIFTQASGLILFIAILALYFIHGTKTGIYTFEYEALLGTSLSPGAAMWLMLGFLIAFAVKLPVIPFHNWLPDAHTEAPTAGSVILAGLLLKTGAYGMLRFVIPLFPHAAERFAPIAMLIGVAGILYGAKLAFAQNDLKRLVAYSSVSHMGFVMVGVFAMNQLAFQGVVLQMIAHGLSTGALFILVGTLQERIHTRDLNQMGGLWELVPKMGGIGLLFTMASLGLPGLGNFIAEFLILAGSYQATIYITVLATLGLIASTIYSLRIMQKVFFGNIVKEWKLPDFNARELLIMGSIIIVIVWLGLFPQMFLNTSKNAMNNLIPETSKVRVINISNKKDFYSNQMIENGKKFRFISINKRIPEVK